MFYHPSQSIVSDVAFYRLVFILHPGIGLGMRTGIHLVFIVSGYWSTACMPAFRQGPTLDLSSQAHTCTHYTCVYIYIYICLCRGVQ